MGTLGVNGSGASASRRPAMSRFVAGKARPDEHRALVPVVIPVTEIDPDDHPIAVSHRPTAQFLAHLIATAEGEPQTRDHRRAAPDVAAHAYEATAAQMNGIVFLKN